MDNNIISTLLWNILFMKMISYGSARCPTIYCGDSYCRSYETPDRCLYLASKNTNWFESKDFCDKLQMSMLQIKNRQVQTIIEQMNLKMPYWLGARGSPLNDWTWLNSDASYPVEGSHAVEDYCGTIKWVERYSVIPDSFEVIPGHCAIPGHFICRKDDCHSFYADCLAVVYTPLTWFKAREFCLERSSDLLFLRPGESINQLRRWMIDRVKDGLFFIGLRKKKWTWLDDFTRDMYFTNWEDNQPRTQGGSCLQIIQRGSYWRETDCSETAASICIYDKSTQPLPDIPITLAPTTSTIRTTTTSSTTQSTTLPTSPTTKTITTTKSIPTTLKPSGPTLNTESVAFHQFTVSTTTNSAITSGNGSYHSIGMIIAIVALAVVLITGAIAVAVYLTKSKSSSDSSSTPITMSQLQSEPNIYEEIGNQKNEACAASFE